MNHHGYKPVYASFQPFAGAQYTDVAVTGRSATFSTVAHVAKQWWTPTIGARIDMQSGAYLVRLEGDYASFQGGRNGEQVLGAVGYQTSKARLLYPSINIAYRYLYEKNVATPDTVLRLKLQGPLVFFTFHF